MSEHMLMKDVMFMFFLLHMHDHNEPKSPALISSVWPYFRIYLTLPFSFLVFSLSFLPFLLHLFPNVNKQDKGISAMDKVAFETQVSTLVP